MSFLVPTASGDINDAIYIKAIQASEVVPHGTTNVSIPTASDITGQAFNPLNLVDPIRSNLILIANKSGSTQVTATLQEDTTGAGAWADTALVITALSSNIPTAITSAGGNGATGFLNFYDATGYVPLYTTGNRYRWKYRATTSAITCAVILTATTTIWSQTYYGANVAPALADLCHFTGPNATAIIITGDSGGTLFTGTNFTTISATDARVTGVCHLSTGCTLDIDASAGNSTLTLKSTLLISGEGHLKQHDSSSPVPAANISAIVMDPTTAMDIGIILSWNGRHTMNGAEHVYKLGYVGGLGTAASPFEVDAAMTNAQVGDEIVIEGTNDGATNYNEGEQRFIRTIVDSTHVTLAATAGGAEAGLTYSHAAGAVVFNLSYNAVIRSADITKGFFYNNSSLLDGSTKRLKHKNFRIQQNNNGSNNSKNLAMTQGSSIAGSSYAEVNDGVYYRTNRFGVTFGGLANDSTDYTDLVVAYDQSAFGGIQGGGGIRFARSNLIAHRIYAINCQGEGIDIRNVNVQIDDAQAFNCAIGAATRVGGLNIVNNTNSTILNAGVHGCRGMGLFLSNVLGLYMKGLKDGTRGKNPINIMLDDSGGTYSFIDVVFEECEFDTTATLVSGYRNCYVGSEIKFQKYNLTDNYHFWYTPDGKASLTGLTGCPDTFTFDNGNPALLIEPETTSPGFTWQFLKSVKALYAQSILMKAQKNATFGTDVATLNLYLPGSTTPEKTVNAPNDTAENTLILGNSYTGAVPRLHKVEVIAKSAASGAKLYIGNVDNGTNDLINLKTWHNGKPAEIMYPELGDPKAVWAEVASVNNTAGTMGAVLNLISTINTFINKIYYKVRNIRI